MKVIGGSQKLHRGPQFAHPSSNALYLIHYKSRRKITPVSTLRIEGSAASLKQALVAPFPLKFSIYKLPGACNLMHNKSDQLKIDLESNGGLQHVVVHFLHACAKPANQKVLTCGLRFHWPVFTWK